MTRKLAVFAPDLGASFIERHVRDLSPGHTVAIASRSSHGLFGAWRASCPVLYLDQLSQTPHARIRRRFGASEAAMRELAVERFLKRHGVEVVLGEFLSNFIQFVPLIERLGLPYVVQAHGIDVSARLRSAEVAESYAAYKSARMVLTRCEPHRRRLIELGLPAGKVQVNHGGVDVPDQAPTRGPESATRFLAIARMDAKKGPIYLLEAFRRAALERGDITLDYVGEGPLLPAARQFVQATGLGERVRLHGLAPEAVKLQLLFECGVFVQHSITDPATGDEEGLPASIQEAMAGGLMVISTRHAGIPEAVTHGETGWLVEEGDVAAMARAIADAPAVAAEMGAKGHAQALAGHAWRHEAERLQGWLFEEDVPVLAHAS